MEARRAFVFDDGGRAAAGLKGETSDCVTRAIAIATGLPYAQVYASLFDAMRTSRRRRERGSPRNGVHRQIYEKYLATLGWKFAPTMGIGTGCRVHLRGEELPRGRIIARCSKHLVAVIDGIAHDTHDSTRGGTRCVYGYYSKSGGPMTLLRLVVDQPPPPAVKCSGCGRNFSRLPTGVCCGCEFAALARDIVGLPPKPARCCERETRCACGGAFCPEHGQRCTGGSHD